MSAKKVELPDFWEKHPHLWFARAEEEFSLKGISQDSTRYSYLVARLPESVAARVHDELMAKDDKLPYTVLKARLLTTFSPSDYQRGEQILDLPASHAEKPLVTISRDQWSVLGCNLNLNGGIILSHSRRHPPSSRGRDLAVIPAPAAP